jgi:NADH-quinone oxidoreductase subunit M
MNLIWASILIPVATAAIIAVANARAARSLAAFGSLVSLGALVTFAWRFPAWSTGAVFPEPCGCVWLESINATLGVGFDSVSLMLALLEAFLIPICVIGSWTAIAERQREYYGWFMLLHASILLAFAARDVLLFYVGYEFTLVPLLFLIAIWGGPERRQAAHKLFLYTFLGSLFFLGSILFVGWQHHWPTTKPPPPARSSSPAPCSSSGPTASSGSHCRWRPRAVPHWPSSPRCSARSRSCTRR